MAKSVVKTELSMLNYCVTVKFPNCDSINEYRWIKEIHSEAFSNKRHKSYNLLSSGERVRENKKHMGQNDNNRLIWVKGIHIFLQLFCNFEIISE